MGLEPTPGPWQGPVLPLYYDRPETGKLYHVRPCGDKILSASHKVILHAFAEARRWRTQRCTAKPVLCILADLKHASCFNDGRLPLAVSKLGGFGAVGIHTSKPLSVFIKNCNLPVLVLASSVLPQLGAFSVFQ